jgi:hypothetical protein
MENGSPNRQFCSGPFWAWVAWQNRSILPFLSQSEVCGKVEPPRLKWNIGRFAAQKWGGDAGLDDSLSNMTT